MWETIRIIQNVSTRLGRVDWNDSKIPSYTKGKKSLPVWVEWIETISYIQSEELKASLPVWVEWIETFPPVWMALSGLVSTRLGRVDWNKWNILREDGSCGSLPVWVEWIETCHWGLSVPHRCVSTRLGRVDWNTESTRLVNPFMNVSTRLGRVDWNDSNPRISASTVTSLPVWVEWIETPWPFGCTWRGLSLPVWVEWIETFSAWTFTHRLHRLYPFG